MKQKLCILLFFVAGISMANGHDFKRFGKENPPEINVDVVANVILKVVGNASSGIYKLIKKSGEGTLIRLIKATDTPGYKLAIATNGVRHELGKIDEEGVIKITDELNDGEVLETLEDVSYLDDGVATTGDLNIVQKGDEVGIDVVVDASSLIQQLIKKFDGFGNLQSWVKSLDEVANAKLLAQLNDLDASYFKKLDADLANSTFKDAIENKPGLVGAWKKMVNLNAIAVIRRNPGAVEALAKKTAGKEAPLPNTYLSKEYIANHLAKFDEGAVRFTTQSKIDEYGTLGGKEAFVIPKSEFDDLLAETGRDFSKIEKRLGLNPGDLTGDDAVIAWIKKEDIGEIKIPSGNEGGANEFWIPGGKTSGGVSEGVVDLSNQTIPYTPL